MKKLLMMACLAAFVLTGCNDGKNNAANNAAQSDSLNSIIAQKDSELNDMLGTLNEIEAVSYTHLTLPTSDLV